MSQSPYLVRVKTPLTDKTIEQFALKVSDALVRLSKTASDTSVVSAESIQGTTGSWAIALYDEVTGLIAFLPGVRFIPIGADDVNIGFELDVSPKVGSEIGGTSQGYMFNFGTVEGSKLAAGISANNEDVNIPRIDVGFKPKRGARMEFYGNDGDVSNDRKGQFRAILGPGGHYIIYRYRYVSGDTWEVIGGFDEDGALVCGLKDNTWPTSLPAVVNVFNQAGGAAPVATIDKDGVITGTKVVSESAELTNGTKTITIDPTSATSSVTLTLQQKTFVGDTNPSWVLCASV